VLPDEFFEPRILLVSGKGGVGKTTVSAGLALVAARNGRKVCVAEVDRKETLARLLGGGAVGYEPAELSPGVWGMSIVPEEALAEYLEVQYHMRRISRVFSSTQFLDYVTTAAPGLADILVLGKVWYLEQGRSRGVRHDFDTIVVDAPAAGHMLTFMSAPMGLSDAVRSGPVRRQSDWLIDMLRDPRRTRVHLVTLPEEMPVLETIETSEALRGRVAIPTGAVFANAVYPPLFSRSEVTALKRLAGDGDMSDLGACADEVGLRLDAEDVDSLVGYAGFLTARRALQAAHLKTLRREMEETVIELPFLFSAGLELPDIETLADEMEEAIEKL
jgi:anion-transporting  ArsA/GET3 family ATPase